MECFGLQASRRVPEVSRNSFQKCTQHRKINNSVAACFVTTCSSLSSAAQIVFIDTLSLTLSLSHTHSLSLSLSLSPSSSKPLLCNALFPKQRGKTRRVFNPAPVCKRAPTYQTRRVFALGPTFFGLLGSSLSSYRQFLLVPGGLRVEIGRGGGPWELSFEVSWLLVCGFSMLGGGMRPSKRSTAISVEARHTEGRMKHGRGRKAVPFWFCDRWPTFV